MKRIVRLAIMVAVVSSTYAHAQGVRTVIAGTVAMDSGKPDGVSLVMHYNEAIGIEYPEDATFIEGVEFELRIPKAFKGSEASVAWSVYSSVTPAPSAELLDYEAELIATQTLPARVSMNLVLPMIERHGIQGGPFASLIPSVASADRFPLVFKLSPVGKGFNPSMEAAEFKLTVRPILGNEGGISISVHFPEGEEHGAPSIFVDDKLIQDESSVILAKKGARVLRISAEGYREEVVTIAVEPGRVVPVSVALTPNAPFIVFQAPDGTVVTLDGKPLAKEDLDGLAVEPGEHTLAFKIGDYSMTRKLMALRGKTYQVILSVELEIDTAP